MIRAGLAFLLMWVLALGAVAQDLSGLARLDQARSGIDDSWGSIEVTLELSQGVPYRVYTLDEPRRLVMDFREVDWTGVEAEALNQSKRVTGLRMGGFRPGWSRLVADLDGPYGIESVDAQVDESNGVTRLEVNLTKMKEAKFTAQSGAPKRPGWEASTEGLPAVKHARQTGGERILVVLDPGHGGVDPGAERDGDNEKVLMLRFAQELREILLRAGEFDVAMTREEDRFVSLDRRVAIAHELGADVFVSLHADALSEGGARGATIYTLSETASDEASVALAERHNRTEILAGIDLSETDDVVADVLIDLARTETQPRSDQLAEALKLSIKSQGLPLNSRPLRQAGFAVLKSPDIPSVLVEVGFMSSERDLANIRDPEWRATMGASIRDALQAWRIADAAAAELVRQ